MDVAVAQVNIRNSFTLRFFIWEQHLTLQILGINLIYFLLSRFLRWLGYLLRSQKMRLSLSIAWALLFHCGTFVWDFDWDSSVRPVFVCFCQTPWSLDLCTSWQPDHEDFIRICQLYFLWIYLLCCSTRVSWTRRVFLTWFLQFKRSLFPVKMNFTTAICCWLWMNHSSVKVANNVFCMFWPISNQRPSVVK